MDARFILLAATMAAAIPPQPHPIVEERSWPRHRLRAPKKMPAIYKRETKRMNRGLRKTHQRLLQPRPGF